MNIGDFFVCKIIKFYTNKIVILVSSSSSPSLNSPELRDDSGKLRDDLGKLLDGDGDTKCISCFLYKMRNMKLDQYRDIKHMLVKHNHVIAFCRGIGSKPIIELWEYVPIDDYVYEDFMIHINDNKPLLYDWVGRHNY